MKIGGGEMNIFKGQNFWRSPIGLKLMLIERNTWPGLNGTMVLSVANAVMGNG